MITARKGAESIMRNISFFKLYRQPDPESSNTGVAVDGFLAESRDTGDVVVGIGGPQFVNQPGRSSVSIYQSQAKPVTLSLCETFNDLANSELSPDMAQERKRECDDCLRHGVNHYNLRPRPVTSSRRKDFVLT
ncbi:hypothetical protein NDU88_000778 [Pleurodeles waltl]|uniref:Uncharacterized protein n=1 Tax=Pleurodeles waltl TaxID=8319 RepID=A0AAV7TGE5_PLEWA|nr:hypothetical protein NDU88_000778 [Pleurodeles waltl]